jgi:hypothetical protein
MKDEQFIVDKAKLVEGKIEWNGDNIHSNMVYIYEKIAQFKPESVFEGGFGGGQNLFSIQKLFPDAKVGGVELLESQLEFGIQHFNMPREFFTERPCYFADFSIPHIAARVTESFDLVYTNAVIMHLNSAKAINFLANLIYMKPKYMVLVEGVARSFDEHEWPTYFEQTKMLDYYNDISDDICPMAKVLVRKDL